MWGHIDKEDKDRPKAAKNGAAKRRKVAKSVDDGDQRDELNNKADNQAVWGGYRVES